MQNVKQKNKTARSLNSLEIMRKIKNFKPVFLDTGKIFEIFLCSLNHDFKNFNIIYHSTQSGDYLW